MGEGAGWCWRRLATVPSTLGFLSLNLIGCGFKQPGYLYAMNTGRASRLLVDHAGEVSGDIRGDFPGGGRCAGKLREVTPDNAREMAGSRILISDNADAAVAVLRCGNGTILRCAVVARPGEGLSYGSCTDARGAEYALLFERGE